MAKRSPILGYNHNVRYRGLVFHVQTEDSGVLSPHLFTHLFHEGVIVSTRKLVYDAGADEDAIKALMQAQHKAVMKDLKKGTFDDKIDAYLGGTPGLEPREGAPAAAPLPRGERAATEQGAVPESNEVAAESPIEIVNEGLSAPIELPLKQAAAPPAPPAEAAPAPPVEAEPPPAAPAAKARTITAQRTSRSQAAAAVAPTAPKPQPPPPPVEDDAPTLMGDNAGAVAAAVQAGNRAQPQAPTRPTPPVAPPAPPPPPPSMLRPNVPAPVTPPSRIPPRAQEILDISLEPEEKSSRHRVPRDTAVENPPDFAHEPVRSDGIPPRPGGIARAPQPPPSQPAARAVAASLPPRSARTAITPPAVVSRPIPSSDGHVRREADARDSDAIEVYAPAPPSVEPPPGERAERPGQYSVGRSRGDVPMREKTGRIAAVNPNAIPALNRPRTGGDRSRDSGSMPTARDSGSMPTARDTATMPAQDSGSLRAQDSGSLRAQDSGSIRAHDSGSIRAHDSGSIRGEAVSSGRVATPAAPRVTAPIATRPHQQAPGSGVVMTRPAVIVGAPPKPPPAPPQRVRKAREDEGRGFGQGLISEKSLDEVILAYLSEDAEEK